MSLQNEEYPLKERIDRSNDPYYQGLFWCFEAQQYFRWQEMQDWYAEQTRIAAEVEIIGAPI